MLHINFSGKNSLSSATSLKQNSESIKKREGEIKREYMERTRREKDIPSLLAVLDNRAQIPIVTILHV
jgi:hypothetical protein